MIEFKSNRSRAAAYLGAALLVVSVLFFLLRGPYLSNYIKRIIVPQLENITRERVMIDKAVINLFPFYVQAKGLKMYDEDGNKLLWVTKSRAYIDLTPLLGGELRIRKLTIKEPDLTADDNDIERIIANVKKSSSVGEEGRFRVSLRNVELTDGRLKYVYAGGRAVASGEGIFINMMTRWDRVTASLRFDDGMFNLPNGMAFHGGFSLKALMSDGKITVTDLSARSTESVVDLDGGLVITKSGTVEGGTLDGSAKIYVSTINEAFGLEGKADGLLTFKGSIDIAPGKDPARPLVDLDLKTDSSFYLESLMGMIGVEENITGLVSVKGGIKGRFPDVTGKGKATLEKAVFDTLPLDDVAGEILYKDGRFTLNNFKAHTFEGQMDGYAHIEIPEGDYAVDADVTGINSLKLFKYIGWVPPFPVGKIAGEFRLNDDMDGDFEIAASLEYLNDAPAGPELIERVRRIETSLELIGDLLAFDDTVLYTSLSELFLKGDIDFQKDTIDLDLRLETGEINDLTAPYYTEFKAPGIFKGKAGGPLSDIEIFGRLDVSEGSLHGLPLSGASSGFRYRAGFLDVQQLNIEQSGSSYDAAGTIEFRDSKEMFQFSSPYYRAEASIKNAGIKQFAAFFPGTVPVDGSASGELTFDGDHAKFAGSGDLLIRDANVYGQDIAKAEMKAVFGPDMIEFRPLDVYHGESVITANGVVFYDGKFNLDLSSGNFDTCDINETADHPLGLRFSSFKVRGSGTLESPDISFSGDIIESYLNEKEIGTGEVKGTFKGRELNARGEFAGGLVAAQAEASFAADPSWDVSLELKRGNYDFLISGLVEKAPDDIALKLEGEVKAVSSGNKYNVLSRFDFLELGVWGYELINDKDVVLEIINDELLIKSLSMRDEKSDVYASGSVLFNKSYNVALTGNLDLTSLSSVSEKIGSIEGLGSYVINIVGGWSDPEINGEVSVEDTTVLLTDMAYKIGPLNGDFVFDRGKVTFDSVRTGFAGGSVDLSGVGYLDKLSIDKLYVSASLSDIKVRPLERVSVALGGNLFYETSDEGSSFTGNIDIKKAKYQKDVEFDKLILGLKEMEGKKVEYPDFIRDTALNIHVEGRENIVIDNNIAATPVSLSLNLMGTVGSYGLLGKVDTLGGDIYFRNNEFSILEGSSVEFISTESVLPVFHILAESFISDYYIKLSLDGTMDQFNLTLFSDPPLSETDILTLLTFGQFQKGVKGFESGLAASEAASMLTGDLQEAVETKFRNITGFEKFQIEPHTAATGAFGPKVTIGKRLIEDKLSVIYSTSVGTTEEHIIKLKYNISKSVAVIGSRDEIGSAGVDLKYRFEFK